MEEEYFNEEFMNIIASNDWSELEEDNQPRFYDVSIQPISDMTIIPIGYVPNLGMIELVIKMKDL